MSSDGVPSSAAPPLAGRHALVTGAGRGIGRAIALRLAAEGATVSLIGRQRARLDAVAGEIGPAAVLVRACDITDAAAVTALFAELTRHPALDILVNNAGAGESAPLDKTDDALWERMLAVNLTAAFRVTRAAIASLKRSAHGRVVNIASTAGLTGYPYVAAYCAAKHGIVGFTRALARELASTTVTVNAVCPGYTDTDLVADAAGRIAQKTGRSLADARDLLAASNPQGRLVAPSEVAATVAWLCRPESQAITGQSVAVAGGEVLSG